MDKKKILVVEDEKAISDILVFNLQREGYDTLAAYDGAEGLRCALEEAPDLILLDVMLPEMDGFEVCRRVRAEKDTPIIMLTAREEETDKVMGLELGADDYITKPFSMRELWARVKANMRRTYAGEDREKAEAPSGGGLRVSKDNGMVYKNGHPLELSAREFDILCFLSAAPGRVFSREELMEQVWGYDYYGDLRAVTWRSAVCARRSEDEPASPRYIITKRGMGYYFADGEVSSCSVHYIRKLVLILVLLIVSVMAVVGTFLINSINTFYLNSFYEQMQAVFTTDTIRSMQEAAARTRHGWSENHYRCPQEPTRH